MVDRVSTRGTTSLALRLSTLNLICRKELVTNSVYFPSLPTNLEAALVTACFAGGLMTIHVVQLGGFLSSIVPL